MCENKLISVNMSGNELSEGNETAHCLNANDQRKVFGAKQERTMVAVSFQNGEVGNEIDTAHCLCGNYATKEGIRSHQQVTKVIMPVLTPEREEKRQNGRRFKDNNEDMFTLTAQDRHGVAISVPKVIGGIGEKKSNNGTQFFQQDRIYDADHVAPSLQANLPGGSNKVAIKVKEATKQGYAIAQEGDSINLSMPDSKTRRGRIGGAVAQTLDTSCNQGVIETIKGNTPSEHPGQYVEIYPGTIVYAVWYEKYQCYVAIRKLTPRECFRLQGWTDDYFEKAQFVNSDSQLYKQAGNGVTVNVVEAIAKEL